MPSGGRASPQVVGPVAQRQTLTILFAGDSRIAARERHLAQHAQRFRPSHAIAKIAPERQALAEQCFGQRQVAARIRAVAEIGQRFCNPCCVAASAPHGKARFKIRRRPRWSPRSPDHAAEVVQHGGYGALAADCRESASAS